MQAKKASLSYLDFYIHFSSIGKVQVSPCTQASKNSIGTSNDCGTLHITSRLCFAIYFLKQLALPTY